MQTFLPYADFDKTSKCLDYRRLGKQRIETWQIYNILKQIKCKKGYSEHDYAIWNENIKDFTCINCGRRKKLAWENHPIVKMWEGYEHALLWYGFIICYEWRKRGYKGQMLEKFMTILINNDLAYSPELPEWLGNKDFHASHRSNLLRKDKNYYSKFGWTEPPNLPYIWIGNQK
jgi:hypothetical protein